LRFSSETQSLTPQVVKINPELPDWFEDFLLAVGLSRRTISRSSLDTSFYHDLNIYGDEADPIIEEMERRIDMSSFNVDLYFPPEFPGGNFISNMIYRVTPKFHKALGLKEKYLRLTFADVMKALEIGGWGKAHGE